MALTIRRGENRGWPLFAGQLEEMSGELLGLCLFVITSTISAIVAVQECMKYELFRTRSEGDPLRDQWDSSYHQAKKIHEKVLDPAVSRNSPIVAAPVQAEAWNT